MTAIASKHFFAEIYSLAPLDAIEDTFMTKDYLPYRGSFDCSETHSNSYTLFITDLIIYIKYTKRDNICQ